MPVSDVLTAAAYFSAGMKIYDPIPEPSPRSAFASVLAAAMCLLVLYDAVRTAAAAVPTTAKTPSPENLGLWSAIAGLFLAASVLLGFFGENRGLKTIPVVCAVIGALSVNLAMFACYFDFTIPLNSPVRNFTTLMQAAILLFLFSEARLMIVKEPKELPPPFQLATEYAAVILGMGVSLGGILWRVIRMILAAGGSDFFLAGPEPNLPRPSPRRLPHPARPDKGGDRRGRTEGEGGQRKEKAEARRAGKQSGMKTGFLPGKRLFHIEIYRRRLKIWITKSN